MTRLTATSEVYREVETRISQAYQGMARGDLEGLMTLYTPDAVIQSPGEAPVEGSAEIREFWRGTFATYRVEMVPTLSEVTQDGDLVVVRGTASGAFRPIAGAPAVQVNSWFMQIYRRQGSGGLAFWRGANGPNPQLETKR
ncbi:MAG: nuclear transport factor 2 family protein [Polyangiaceae bacterium]|nr:nuclear transport factor 2 family protein [Myxococcales bacterium]MCB9586172.1 nuclear transport factor 2 family protein [Polyangiaceae bacterium]MCB9606849.1 nuclear transport factor 2 family protein [Polyangiaceae bacterium]